jgi:hypothetical protein
MKNVDIAFYNYLKTVADGSVQAGISTGTPCKTAASAWPPSMIGTASSQPI